jgi:hypothetical protein
LLSTPASTDLRALRRLAYDCAGNCEASLLVSASTEAKMSKEDNRGYPADLASSASSCAISLIYAAVKCVFASSFVCSDCNIAFLPTVILQNDFFTVMMLYIIAWFILDEL